MGVTEEQRFLFQHYLVKRVALQLMVFYLQIQIV